MKLRVIPVFSPKHLTRVPRLPFKALRFHNYHLLGILLLFSIYIIPKDLHIINRQYKQILSPVFVQYDDVLFLFVLALQKAKKSVWITIPIFCLLYNIYYSTVSSETLINPALPPAVPRRRIPEHLMLSNSNV